MNGVIDFIRLDKNGISNVIFPKTVTDAIYIGNNTSGKTLASYLDRHQHNMADIVDLNVDSSGNVVFNTLTLLLNGNVAVAYNGVEQKSLDISLQSLGAAASNHNHDTAYSKLNHTHGNYAPLSHTHSMSDITDFSGGGVGEIKALTIQIDGFNQVRFNGTTEQTLNLTLDKLGAAGIVHRHGIADVDGLANLTITLQNGTSVAYNPSTAKSITIDAAAVGAATASHDHGLTYAPYDHNHESMYASKSHNHDNVYPSKTEMEEVKKSVADGKTSVASAISAMGVSTAATATFSTMSTNIGNIRKQKVLFEGGSWHNDFAASAWDSLRALPVVRGLPVNPKNYNNWIKFEACMSSVPIDVTGYDYIEIEKQTWYHVELLYLAVLPESSMILPESAYDVAIFKIPTFSICMAPEFIDDANRSNGKDIARINVKNLTGRCYLYMVPFHWTNKVSTGLHGLSDYVLNSALTNINDASAQYIRKIALVSHSYFT